MKSIFTLLLLFAIINNPFAQTLNTKAAMGNLNIPIHHHRPNRKKATVKPILDSICEWSNAGYYPPAGSPPNNKTIDFSYDFNGNLLSNVNQQLYWPVYQNVTNVNNTYTAFDSLSTVKTQQWGSNAWADYTLNTYCYNINKQDSCLLHQVWNGSAWINNYRYLYYYNAGNFDSCYIYQAWNGSAWVNNYNYIYQYNANNIDTCQIEQKWDTGTWVNDSKYSDILNINNLDSVTITSFWGWGGINAWHPYEKDFYTYDTNNNIISDDYWDDNAGWINIRITNYTYDTYNRLVSIYSFWGPASYDLTNYYYYTDKIDPQIIIPIYPNPNKGSFTIDNNGRDYTNCQLDIYNMLGQKVYSYNLGNFNWPVYITLDMPGGMYFVRLTSDQGTVNRKIELTRSK